MTLFRLTVFSICLALLSALPEADLVSSPPGMIGAVIYSGFLKTNVANREIHYVFVAAATNPDTAPLTIWLNGGPGCSSLIGMLQEIGPFIIGNNYTLGDQLTPNEFSWNKASNLLFLESPAIVGFSTDTNTQVEYTDSQTADDAFTAIKDFLVKAPEFAARELFITGQSYAGKYIPDITVRILDNNQDSTNSNTYINIKGILIGNGVMDFRDSSLTKSSIKYMVQHDFISNRMLALYSEGCTRDFQSPRCRFFRYEFDVLRAYLNHYNVYEVCQLKSLEAIRLLEATSSVHEEPQRRKKLFSSQREGMQQSEGIELGEIPSCPSDQGMISYWNLNKGVYLHNMMTSKVWSPCSRLKYTITQAGSINQYMRIRNNGGVKLWLFNGDWDDVVPYPDTEKNLVNMGRTKAGNWEPWFVGEHHAGFYQAYLGKDKLQVVTVKGASHMVPQTKPQASYQMFYNFVNNRPINTPV